jgi:hypothetical protein
MDVQQILQGARQRQKRRAEVLRDICAVLEGKADASVEVVTRGKRIIPFWDGKISCWEMCRCPDQIRDECQAYINRLLPCWEIEGTFGKLTIEGSQVNGRNTTNCQTCRVYKKYGDGKPIRLEPVDSASNL